MKIKFLLLALVVSGFLTAEPVFAQAPLQYTLLEPIGGLQEASTDGNLSGLIGAVFRILFSLIALWAVGLFVAGGIMYMTTEIAGTFDKAKKMLWSALYALLILAGSYLLLNTINPDLLRFQLRNPNPSSIPAGSNTSSTPQKQNFPGTECNTIDGKSLTFSASSPCGKSIIRYQLLDIKYTYLGVQLDGAVFVPGILSDDGMPDTMNLQKFSSGCTTVGGKTTAERLTNASGDVYLCTKP